MRGENTPAYYITKYRAELMGFAILWVVWFHSKFSLAVFPVSIANRVLSFLQSTGYGGVDIFLFVSGFGIYHSLQKNSVSDYLKNRLKKILPIWWTSSLLVVCAEFLVFKTRYTYRELFGLAFFSGLWADLKHQGNWYVYAIMFLYMISPVLYALIRDGKNKTKTFIIMTLVSLCVSLSFFGQYKLIVFSRIPVYILGMFAAACCQEFKMKKTTWIACFAAFGIGYAAMLYLYSRKHAYLEDYGLWWYPFYVIAPTMSLLICKVFDCVPKTLRHLRAVLRVFGQASLEILLVTDYIFFSVAPKISFGAVPENAGAFCIAAGGIALGCLFHYLIEHIKKLFSADKADKAVQVINNGNEE